MISGRRTEIRSAHLALQGRPTVGDKGLTTPSSADNRLIDTTQTAREESEIFIRKPEVRDPKKQKCSKELDHCGHIERSHGCKLHSRASRNAWFAPYPPRHRLPAMACGALVGELRDVEQVKEKD